jgi:pimeloyl-ACP methyl ester carboxylesterase
VALLAVVGILLAAGAGAKAKLKAAYPPPGQLVDVGEYRLHLSCLGTGAPVVVMEAGAGDAGFVWALVQPRVAEFTTACVYDRAGHGWSDPGPLPPTAWETVRVLHTLLEHGGLAGPRVLVGHSLGGPIVRLYRAAYPGDVAGMVLVDSAHEAQVTRLPAAYKEIAQKFTQSIRGQLRLAITLTRSGVLALRPGLFPTHPRLPEDAAAASRALAVTDTKWLEAIMAEQEAVEDILAEVGAADVGTMADLPLVVLARGRPDALPPQVVLAPEVVADAERVWRELQAELAARSSQGRLVVADRSGHYIQLDEPALVVTAIRQVVESVRR